MNSAINIFIHAIHYSLVALLWLLDLLHIRGWVSGFLKTVTRLIVRGLFHLLYGLDVEGAENIRTGQAFILACNHQSYLDPLLIGSLAPRNVTPVSKIENFHTPILGPLIELAGAEPIDRAGGHKTLDVFEKILSSGGQIIIYPEGTIPGEESIGRTCIERDTGLLQGRTGAVRLALATGTAIIPCGISGTGDALPPEAIPRGKMPMFRLRKKIKVRFGSPIFYNPRAGEAATRDELRKLTDRLMKEISGLVDFSMSYPPYRVPVSDEDYKNLRKFEGRAEFGRTQAEISGEECSEK